MYLTQFFGAVYLENYKSYVYFKQYLNKSNSLRTRFYKALFIHYFWCQVRNLHLDLFSRLPFSTIFFSIIIIFHYNCDYHHQTKKVYRLHSVLYCKFCFSIYRCFWYFDLWKYSILARIRCFASSCLGTLTDEEIGLSGISIFLGVLKSLGALLA